MSWFCFHWREEDYRTLLYYKSRIGKNFRFIDETLEDPDADAEPLPLPPGALIENQYYKAEDLITPFPLVRTGRPMRRAFTPGERALITEIKGKECVSCGKRTHLQIHHINGDRSNNAISNLEMRCDDCHKDLHMVEK